MIINDLYNNKKQDVAEAYQFKGGFPFDVDHMPGPTIKRTQTGCKRCHGKGYVYKTPDGQVHPMNRPDAKTYKCGKCGGIGFVKVTDQGMAEGITGKVVFSGTGADGGKYEVIQSGLDDYMIHANGKHVDTYSSLQRAMSVLQNEVPGLQQSMEEGWKSALGGAALAGSMALGGAAQAQSNNDYLPDMVAHVTFAVNGKTITKDYNLGSKYGSARAAAEAVTNMLKSKGIKYTDINIERVSGEQTANDYMDRSPAADQGVGNFADNRPLRSPVKSSDDDYMVKEVNLGDYRKKAQISQAGAKINRFFDRDDAAKVASADQTIAKRERGLARADARNKPYTPPKFDAEKYQRDLTAKYPNIDELVAKAELNRDPDYEMADGQAYYAARDAEQNYQKLRQIQRVIQGLNKSQIKENKMKLKEAILVEDPIYRTWKTLGQTLVERRMSEKEILQVFADAEAGMTDKATGANRTMLGRGKDTTMDFAGQVKDAVSGVLNSIQNSVPVTAVDVAYDQATDALSKLTGGQKGKVMQAIKVYRNLVKQYPKTSGFAKAALVAIAGLATGGAGLPAIAGLTYALDSAIRGDKLSSVLGKGAGSAALATAGQAIAGALTPDAAAATAVNPAGMDYNYDNFVTTNPNTTLSPSEFAAQQAAGGQGSPTISGATDAVPSRFDDIVSNSADYKVKPGDTLSDILADRKINPEAFKRLPGNDIFFSPDGNPNILKAGQTIKLPDPADIVDLNKMSYTTPDPANYARFDKDFDTTGYTGQYNPNNSAYSLDATTNLKQQGLGRLGPDSGIANRVAMRESLKFVTLPVDRLIDRELTAMSWVVNESVYNIKHRGLWLTQAGTYAVFENIDRYRLALMEKAGVPGSTRPEYYRPDMPDGPGKASKPGMIGRGLNWLDQKTKAVGGALSNFGHQFTTDVTKEKLKMNWHQAGKPSDSDQLAAWLVTQGVPQQVVSGVFKKMSIPYTPPQAAATTAPTTATTPAVAPQASAAPAPTTAPTTAPQASAAIPPGEDPKGANYVGRREVARRQAARAVAPQPTTTSTPNFGQQTAPYRYNAPATKAATASTAPPAPKIPKTATTDQQQQEYYRALGLAENLEWSPTFNPGRSLYRQMKQDR